MSAPRVLPADVYDALELSALVFGGIGAGSSRDPEHENVPLCVMGHACWLEGSWERPWAREMGEVRQALFAALGDPSRENDVALAGAEWVYAPRVPFDEWCRRLNVVRADEPTYDPANFPPRRSTSRAVPRDTRRIKNG